MIQTPAARTGFRMNSIAKRLVPRRRFLPLISPRQNRWDRLRALSASHLSSTTSKTLWCSRSTTTSFSLSPPFSWILMCTPNGANCASSHSCQSFSSSTFASSPASTTTASSPSTAASLSPHGKEILSVDIATITAAIADGTGTKEEIRAVVSNNRALCADILDSVRQCGFLYLENTPLSVSLIEQTLHWSDWLFNLPLHEKERLHGDGIGGAEYETYYRYTHEGGEDDNIEAFNLCNDAVESTRELRMSYYLSAGFEEEWIPPGRANKWPCLKTREGSRFKESILQYWEKCALLTEILLTAFETALHLEPGILTERHTRLDHTLELKKYHVLPEGFNKIRIADHADLSTLTLLIQDSVGGLQLLDRYTNTWVDVPARNNSVLVNSGNFLNDLSGRRIPSTRHRVVTKERNSGERMSVVFFASPNWDASIKSLVPNEWNQEKVIESYAAGDVMPA